MPTPCFVILVDIPLILSTFLFHKKKDSANLQTILSIHIYSKKLRLFYFLTKHEQLTTDII